MDITFDLKNIDAKKITTFFESMPQIDPIHSIDVITVNDHSIFVIDNFMSKSECAMIINSAETTGFESLKYRDSKRLLCFDSNLHLINTIRRRLLQKNPYSNNIIDTINNTNWTKPYGLENLEWNKNTDQINSCLRIHKYDKSSGFKLHRDAQYVETNNIKSNYTVLIYLNDTDDGETILKIATRECPAQDLISKTVEEEISIIDEIYCEDIVIKPKKGTMVIFDQTLIHCANPVVTTKYILRTDLLCSAKENIKKDIKITNSYYKWNLLAREFFRHAQYLELLGTDDKLCDELYERSISIRVHFDKTCHFDESLYNLIKPITIDKNIYPNLKLISRSGKEYKFSYDDKNTNNKFHILKIACFYSLITSVTSLIICEDTKDNESFHKYFTDILTNIYDVVTTCDILSEPSNNSFEVSDDDIVKTTDFDYVEDFHEWIYTHGLEKITDSKIVKNLICDDSGIYNYKITEDGKPFFSKLSYAQHTYAYYIDDSRCGCCRGGGSKCKDDSDGSVTKYSDIDLSFKYSDLVLELKDLTCKEDTISGNIVIKTPLETFNHASCCCRTVLTSFETEKKYLLFKYNTTFTMDKNTITIKCNPQVII